MAQEHVKGYRHPGDIEIKTFKLVSSTGQVIDLGPIVLEFSVYEEIGAHYMECELLITDSLGLLDDLGGGFTGNEILLVSFRSKDDSLPYRTHCFGLHALENRVRLEEKNEAYTIRGVSVECLLNSRNRISQAYGPSTISRMIENIYTEHFNSHLVKTFYENIKDYSNIRVSKKLSVSPSSGLQKFVIPNLTVDDTLDMLANEADNDVHAPFFIFYENATGYNFSDIAEMVKRPAKERYKYELSNFKDERDTDAHAPYHDPFKIVDFTVVKQTDFLSNIREGAVSSRTMNIDILGRKFYNSDFDPDNSGNFYALNLMTSNFGHDTDPILRKKTPYPKRMNQFLGAKMSLRKRLFDTIIDVTVPGDSEITAGDVIEIDIPVATDVADRNGKPDKSISGRYLVMNVRHKMKGKTGDEFFSFMRCSKI